MSNYSVQQQNVINQYRSANNLGFALSDDAVVEMMLKEMERTGKVYRGFEALVRSTVVQRNEPSDNVFGAGFVAEKNDDLLFMSNNSSLQLPMTKAQATAIDFLHTIISEADTIISNRDKEGGDLSYLLNLKKELFKDEYSRSSINKQINKSKVDLELLEQAARGEAFVTFLGKTTPISFNEMFLQRRGVEFDVTAIADCEAKSQEFAKIKGSYEAINSIKQKLRSATVGNLQSQLSPATSAATIIEAFKLCGVNSIDEINATLADIGEENKDNPVIKKYGKDFHLGKNSNGAFTIYRTASNGYPAEATNEALQLIVSELCERLDKSFANAIGFEIPENMTSGQLEQSLQKEVGKYQKEYEASFQKAYGKKELKSLADTYVQKQQQSVANLELILNVGSMALMVLPGGVAATSGWLLKGATGVRTIKTLQAVNSAAKTMQSVQRVMSLPLMGEMTLRPTELWEQLSSENGMSREEWQAWGQGVLQNTVYMAAGMGASKLAEAGAAYYKTKALVSTLREAGKTTDEIASIVKANPVKFPSEIVKSLNKVDNLAKTLQVSTEVVLDLTSTIAVNKMMGNGDLLPQDVIMSIGFALSGGVLQKQFMPLTTEAKVKFLQDAFNDVSLSRDDALNILKTMDDISSGKITVEDNVKKPTLAADEQINVINKPNEELPMVEYGGRTPSRVASLRRLYSEYLSNEELDILLKLPVEEERAVSNLMFGPGLSFNDARFHYALPTDIKKKVNILLEWSSLFETEDYQAIVNKVAELSEFEIYSILDVASWAKKGSDFNSCIELIKSCKGDEQKIRQIKEVVSLKYEDKSLFTAGDILKISEAGADLPSVINFFKESENFYSKATYNLDKVAYEDARQLVDFACNINEYNLLPLEDILYFADEKLSIDILSRFASLITDKDSAFNLKQVSRLFNRENKAEVLTKFMDDYEKNPKMSLALINNTCYRNENCRGFLEFDDEFTVRYVSIIDSWSKDPELVRRHEQFMENLPKFSKELQEALKEKYLSSFYLNESLSLISNLQEIDVKEFLDNWGNSPFTERLDVLSVSHKSFPDKPIKELYNLLKDCVDTGIECYSVSRMFSPNTFECISKMLDINKNSADEVFSGEFIKEIAYLINDEKLDVDSASIEKVLMLFRESSEIKNDYSKVVRLLDSENSKYMSILDIDSAKKSHSTVEELYDKSFVKFASEAEKFNCSNLAELEAYFKTAKADKAKVGKLLGKIKKETLDDVLLKFPKKVQNVLIGETGTFTAKDLKGYVARLNEKPVLKALIDVATKAGDDCPASIIDTISSLMFDSNLERRLWRSFPNADINYKQTYANTNKIYENAFYPKMLALIKNLPETEYERNLATINGEQFKYEICELMYSSLRVLNEGTLSAIIHNNAPAKVWQILDSLESVKSPDECALWKELFSAKGLKDNEIQQMLSMVGNVGEDILPTLKDKFYKNGKLDVAGMVNDCFSIIASHAGVTFKGEPDYSGWDLRYVPYILRAQANLSPRDQSLLNMIIKSSFEGDYNKFLYENPESGPANLATKKAYEEEGLNFDAWMNFDKVHKFTFAPKNQASNITNVIQSLENDIVIMLENEKLVPLVNECIQKSGVSFDGGNLLGKNGAELSSAEVSLLVDNLIQFAKDHGRELRDAKLLELRDHFGARQKALRQASQVSLPEELTISLWKRDPKHDLFQGHYCGCCISLDGINSRAIVHSLSHVVDNTIELKTSSGETIGKAKVLWMHDNVSGEPIFLVNGFEITGGKEYSQQVRDEFLEFFKEYSKAVAGKEVMIVTADCTYQKVPIDGLKSFDSNINMLGTFPKERSGAAETQTYHLDTFNRQGGSWPKDLDKPKDLKAKVMYEPDNYGSAASSLRKNLGTQMMELIEILDAANIPYGTWIINAPHKYKDVEVMLDNLKILSKNIQELDNPKDKEAEIQFALEALFKKDVSSQIYGIAEKIHSDAAYIARDLSYEVTALFNDTGAPIAIDKDGTVYRGVYSEDKTNIGKTHGRPKSTDSVYSKIMNEIIDLQHKEVDEVSFNKAVRDAYGFRVISPDNPLKPVQEILEEAAQTHKDVFNEVNNGIKLEDAMNDFYEDGFEGSLWKQMTPEQQQSVLNIAIEHKSQPFVDKLVELIDAGKISVEKISNYVTAFEDKIPYLTARQQMLISDAMSAKTGKPAINYYKKPYSTRGSGYTAAQMNIKVWNYDTNVELQYRDGGINGFAEKEHIPYDISENKITVRGKKYDSPRVVLNNLDVDGEYVYKKYRSDVYTYYRLKALGVKNVAKPDIAKMFAEAISEGKKVFKEPPTDDLATYLSIISEEGLESLTH